MLKDQNILLISPERWSKVFVSKHHYAIELAKRQNKVFFLNPPSMQESVKETGTIGVYEVNYKGFVKGLRFLPSFLQRKIFHNKLQAIEKLVGLKFDVIWSFDNSVFFNFSAFPNYVLKICHIVDLNQDFEFAKAASTADICFCTTEFIKEKLCKYNRHVFKINHGFVPNSIHLDVVLPGTNELKALYVGNLDIPYFDWDLLYRIANENKNVDFVLIGPESDDDEDIVQKRQQVKKLENVYLSGAVPAKNLAAYIQKADVLLILYLAEEYKEQLANPHKVMQYLASGKVVVATWTDEYKDKRELLEMSEHVSGLPTMFKDVVLNISKFNSKDLKEKRIKYAMENTYEQQVERVIKAIKKNIINQS